MQSKSEILEIFFFNYFMDTEITGDTGKSSERQEEEGVTSG